MQPDAEVEPDVYWDVGDLSCGQLLVKLKLAFRDEFAPGEVLHLTATGEGIFIDVTAWCGLTGNTLVYSDPPTFIIRKKED
ncbi:hypothetical protein [Corynebacterium frankenforstense]|uniref:sulfurtransferase TusA family protein n=1 Tax=Corynebacterium frankenforstense TaxID=1230998 RepID=UPI0026EDB2BE|nr:hypothetical protein [Corynebacterium frankenforstense]